MKTKSLVAILISITFIAGITPAQEYSLKYKFGGGKTLKYRFETKSDITQEVMGQEMKIQVDSKMVQNLSAEISADKITLTSSLDSAMVHTKIPMKDTTLDLSQMIGKREKIIMSLNGDIISKEMIDTIMIQNDVTKQFTGALNKYVQFPDTTVRVGETWVSTEKDTIEMMGGKIVNNADITYKLIGSETVGSYNCLKIDVLAKNTNEGSAAVMGMNLTIEGTGKTKGTIYFSQEEGIIVSSDTQVDNEMTMATTGEQNMIIPITQSTKSTLNLIK